MGSGAGMGSGGGLICGCSHGKRAHNDPLLEGMCADCECSGFNPSSRPPAPKPAPKPERPAETPVLDRSDDDRVGQGLPDAPAPEPVDSSLGGAPPVTEEPHRVPRAPVEDGTTPTPAPAATPAPPAPAPTKSGCPCPATCDHCGKRCSGKEGHGGDRHFRKGRGGHTWKARTPLSDQEREHRREDQTPVESPEPSPEPGQDVPDLEPADSSTSVQKPVEETSEAPASGKLPEAPVEETSEAPVPEAPEAPEDAPEDPRWLVAQEKHPDGSKRCPHCTEVRPITEFSLVNGSFDRLHGWCKPCTRERKSPMNLTRALRNRARHRASAELIARHRDEFAELYAESLKVARAEAGVLAESSTARELYGEEHPRLRPGRRLEGETAIDRLDVARCPDCIGYHDKGHVCGVCGSSPEHERVTQTAWADTQAKLRERMQAEAVGE